MKTLPFPTPVVHKSFCFAGQPAPCAGYFENDVLPCVCGATEDVCSALAQVQVPATPVAETGHRGRRGLRLEPRRRRHQEPGIQQPSIWKQAG